MAKMNHFRDILDNTVLLPRLRTGFLSGIFYLMDPLANMINYKATTVIVWEIYGSKKKITKNSQNWDIFEVFWTIQPCYPCIQPDSVLVFLF